MFLPRSGMRTHAKANESPLRRHQSRLNLQLAGIPWLSLISPRDDYGLRFADTCRRDGRTAVVIAGIIMLNSITGLCRSTEAPRILALVSLLLVERCPHIQPGLRARKHGDCPG